MNMGSRLQQARRMMGWSLREVAEKTDPRLSHTAIAKYEKGQMMPGSEALIALARALEQPLDFFFRPPLATLNQSPRFRKKSRLSAGEKTRILQHTEDFLERYYEVEDLVGARLDFENPLPTATVNEPEEARAMAKKLRQAWMLGCDPLPNVHELLELKGIKVCVVQSDSDAFDGLSSRTNRGPVVVLASWLNKNLPRKRMTEVHELAHLVLSFPEDITEKQEESLVWSFAGELFLPEESFIDAFGANRTTLSIEELVELKRLFGASIMAIVYRARALGLIDEKLVAAFWKYANHHKWRQRGEPGDDLFQGDESHSRFRQLVLKAVLEEQISLSKAAGLLHRSIHELRQELGDTIHA